MKGGYEIIDKVTKKVIGYTKPGGHYKEIKQRQSGIKNDLERYVKECINCDDDGDGGYPKWSDELANRYIAPPIFILGIFPAITRPSFPTINNPVPMGPGIGPLPPPIPAFP